jgi:hypothetical protein
MIPSVVGIRGQDGDVDWRKTAAPAASGESKVSHLFAIEGDFNSVVAVMSVG